MPWVEKVPRRFDFCGHPPCGLCYDWVEDISVPDQEKVQEILKMDGLLKMGRDLLGRDPTPTEVKQLEDGAERAHAAKKAILEKDPPPTADLVQAYDKSQEEIYFRTQLTAMTERVRKNALLERKRNVLLDQIDLKSAAGSEEKVPKAPAAAPSYYGQAAGGVAPTGNIRSVYDAAAGGMMVQREVMFADGTTQWINIQKETYASSRSNLKSG